MKQTELFSHNDVSVKGMVHAGDPSTSHEAAHGINQCKTKLHQRVLAAFQTFGAMTDGELEAIPEFASYGPSTLRKRRSELFQLGRLKVKAKRRNGRGFNMVVWDLA